MRILVLNYEFPPVGGGGGRAAEDICRGLARMGHDVRVQTSLVRGLPRVESRDGYVIHRSWAMRRRADRCSVPEMFAYAVTNFLPSLRHAVTWKPDLIHVHFAVPSGAVGLIVSLLTGVPYVLSTQLGDVPGGVPEQTDHLFNYLKPFTVPIWRRAAAVTVPAEHIRELAVQAYHVSVETVPNSVDPEQVRQSSGQAGHPRRLIFAGRFNPQKNLIFLLDLLKRIADLDWRMDMLGDGPMMNEVRTAITRLGLNGKVTLRGWVTPEEVENLMAESDVLVLPSLSEGMPVVGLRALAAGLAIAGSAIGGITDLVQDGVNGVLFPSDDLNAAEKALREMLSSDDLLASMKRAGRSAAERFDLDQVAQTYERIFVDVLTRETGGRPGRRQGNSEVAPRSDTRGT